VVLNQNALSKKVQEVNQVKTQYAPATKRKSVDDSSGDIGQFSSI
jgi:hypothetical protein